MQNGCRKCGDTISSDSKYPYCRKCIVELRRWLSDDDYHREAMARRGQDDYTGYTDPTCYPSKFWQ